ncbi:ComEC/Rec2 family competence protein [Corynebacterium sp. sy039]|uniref:ComEC/Rec2 family competence protein n=1 Tax=Corynebacterium sp. sy039 TaxID=2599641 RepID=UPI0011B3995C|nr:ComEC/Rec2 family competence protein [Corynebacterium sp. sy039]QDZ43061.1 ComEC/Rec2 family competence protein [Corynebacterium sp. sy039]
MNDLRLVPAALSVWVSTFVMLRTGQWWCAAAVVAIGVCLCALWDKMQAGVVGLGGFCALVCVGIRMNVLQRSGLAHQLPPTMMMRAQSRPFQTDSGWIIEARFAHSPGSIPIFYRGAHISQSSCLHPGAPFVVSGKAVATDKAVLLKHMYIASDIRCVEQTEPTIWEKYVQLMQGIKDNFLSAVGHYIDDDAIAGLYAAMVMGDTSLQSEYDKQIYAATGLAHLSAVSGGNVAIITTTVMLLLGLCGCSPRICAVGGLVSLILFALFIGYEPSVIRASATGAVSMVAALSITRAPPIHTLSLSVIGIVVWDSDMASNYGFLLSVSATAGIIVLNPIFYRVCANIPWWRIPDVVNRTAAVALAAEMATIPVIAVMNHTLSLVSFFANVLVAAVVAPITVLGLLAIVLSNCGFFSVVAYIPIALCQPLVRWIYCVAERGSQLPYAHISLSQGWVGVAWSAVFYQN